MPRRAALRELLRAHRTADPTELGFLEAMLELTRSAGDPFSRAHWQPGHFTASAFVLSPTGEEILLVLHGKLHRWLQPGGHIDPDDSDVIAAARREVAEETGLESLELLGPGLHDVDIHDIPSLRDQPAHQHFDCRFLFRAGDMDATAASDAKAVRWVPLGQVAEVESDASVMRAVARIRRLWPPQGPGSS